MNTRHTVRAAQALVAAAMLLAVASPWAAEATSRDRPQAAARSGTRCPYGVTHAGGSVCLSKAEFELTRARQAALDKNPEQYQRNALVRCDRLTGDDRSDCVARIQGQGTTRGSVESGGIYRELVTREVGVAPASVPGGGPARP